MIPSIKELTQHSQFQANQNEKQLFKAKRQKALDYYNGRTAKYTKAFFNFTHQVPVANVNVTKRVIDRTSLVYMVEPQ